jgi:FtsZ-interacting cell division protein ZipA
MNSPNILIIIVVIIILFIYWLNRKKINKNKEKMKGFDLIVKFDSIKYEQIKDNPKFYKITSWTKYGKYGFRGFSPMNKDELEIYIIENLNLNKDDFSVIKANPGLYLPS